MTIRPLITFSAEGIPSVQVLPGDTPPTPSNYGGWSVTARQRRLGLTQWNGKDPLRLALPILFDGWRDQTGQEIPISRLSRMALPPLGGGEPPIVHVSGATIPDLGPDDWVIDNIEWGSNVLSEGGIRYRQDATVNLLQYVDDDRVAFRDVTLASGSSKSGWPKTYTTHAGDTLQKIATKFYGGPAKWKKIATANGLRGSKPLKTNTKLRIPAP